jgi:hypothetical protein
MVWLGAGLLALGAACGATVRLLIFIVVLLGAAAIVGVSTLAQGVSGAALNAVLAVVILQIGYAGGIVLRAAIRSARGRKREAAAPTVRATAGQKRQ